VAAIVIVAASSPDEASAAPILPAEIAVGAEVSGFFSYDTSLLAPGGVPGHYDVLGLGNGMSLVVAGIAAFSTSFTEPNILVRVTDGDAVGRSDFIQISSRGDEDSFAPYLDFADQNPSLSPRGELLINFQFAHTYLSTNALPSTFDPLQTVSIFGQVEGVRTTSPSSGFREWAFFFEVNPLSITLVQNETLLRGDFIGQIVGVDDRTNTPIPSVPVPEPSTLLLLGSGMALALRNRRQEQF